MRHQRRLISALVLACGAALAAHARAAQVDLTGDYGTSTWGANASAITFTTSPPLTVTNFGPLTVPGFGSLVGLVEVENINGVSLMMRVTQLTFTATAPVSGGFTNLTLNVIRDFSIAAPGNYTVSHSLSGGWSTATQNAVTLSTNVINLDGTAANVPSIGGLNALGANSFNFSSTTPTNGTASFSTVSLQFSLNLSIQGTGLITLPTSADVHFELVPAPGAGALLGLGGLVAARRRR